MRDQRQMKTIIANILNDDEIDYNDNVFVKTFFFIEKSIAEKIKIFQFIVIAKISRDNRKIEKIHIIFKNNVLINFVSTLNVNINNYAHRTNIIVSL